MSRQTTHIALYTSNLCPRCKQARALLTELIDELGGQDFELEMVDVVKNIDRSVAQGVLTTPSLVINDQLIGALPAREQLRKLLQHHARR